MQLFPLFQINMARTVCAAAVVALLVSVSPVFAQDTLRINEIMAVNEDGITDSDGDASDWIEIFNASAEAANLSGYSLTDDAAVAQKWVFPEGTTLGAGGYLVVFASGKDRSVAGEELHTSFRLSSSEMYVGLFNPNQELVHALSEIPAQQEDVSYGFGVSGDTLPQTFIADEAACAWLVPSEDIGDTWQEPGFDDSAWTAAKLGLGFDYDDITGENGNLQDAMQGVNATVYARVPFEVANPARVVSLKFAIRFEDGYIAYLNGHRIAAENEPDPAEWDADATSSNRDADAVVPVEIELSTEDFSGRLVAGTNILAIHGMNSTTGGSDALFYPGLTGRVSAESEESEGYLQIPSPGTSNGSKVDGFIADTETTPRRGFYDAPIQVTITNPSEGAAVYYTLDETEPTPESGTLYTAPIPISETTVLRTAAHRTGYQSSRIDTHTYMFLDDVVVQDQLRRAPSSDEDKLQMKEALTAIPTISVVATDTVELHKDAARQQVEPQPEQPCSVEWINGDGTEGFQINAGVARFGGFYTTFGGNGENSKKQWRLFFRKKYGKPTLQYPVYDNFEYDNFPPVEEFDALALRSGSHDMQARGAYMSNRFADDSLLDMGNIAPHGRFVHVYINGEYWGQYHLRERWHAAMFARYFGGEKEDYEAVDADNSGSTFQTGHIYDGTGEMWDTARDLVRDGAAADDTFNSVRSHIDLNSYIDFMVVWTSGQSESEFRAGGGNPIGGLPESPLQMPFQFFLKDADGLLRGVTTSRVTHEGPLSILREMGRDRDPEYLTYIGDRLHTLFFNDGAMTGDQQVERLQRRIDEIQVAFHGEAARWNFRTHSSWQSTVNSYLRNRASAPGTVLAAYQRAGLYPDVVAPVFSQHGGTIPASGNVQLTADGLIYYTLDGSDPRLVGGGVSPVALSIDGRGELKPLIAQGSEWKYLDDGSDQGTAWRNLDYDDTAWSTGAGELGYGDRTEATVISFGDSALSKHITYYFRKEFEIAEAERTVELSLGLRRDDGAVVYLNGVEVARSNMPDGPISFDTLSGDDTVSEVDYMPFELDQTLLVNGRNVIAVEVHQESPTSSDVSFDLTLDSILSLGTPTVALNGPTTLRARVLDGEDWSALNEAFYVPAAATPTNQNLVISEMMFNPAPATEAEIAAGVNNADRFEFIELFNIGNEMMNLTDLAFTDGIGFQVLPGASAFVSAKGRVLVVKDVEAFEVRYGAGLPVIGTFTGNLRNSGEQIALEGPSGMIREFAYDDVDPWPVAADGEGPSLELINPEGNPDHADAANWQASIPGGTPGQGDDAEPGAAYAAWRASTFSAQELADPNISGDQADSDRDGLPVILEYSAGGNPTVAEFNLGLDIAQSGDEVSVSYARNKSASGLTYTLEQSADLTAWESAAASLEQSEVVSLSATSERVVLRYVGSIQEPMYIRLKVQSLQ